MQKQTRSLAVLLLVSLGLVSAASANVTAMPSYYDFGAVAPGRSAIASITFMNNSTTPVQFFSVSCNGDTSVFSCFSMCSYLPAFGSCSVQIQFNPRNGDNIRKMLWLNGMGGGSFVTANVYGTDAK
jgi:hypothetical protein